MRLTMPQIILLVHASHINKKRFEREYGSSEKPASHQAQDDDFYASGRKPSANDIVYAGKALNELSAQEYLDYMRV
jgi:hypothetical protein